MGSANAMTYYAGRMVLCAIRKRAASGGLSALAVIAAAVLPYLSALPAQFAFDDVAVIRDNAAVQVLPVAGLLTYVFPQPGAYRPATMLTYAAQARLGCGAFGFHLANVVLHALVSLCVLLLAHRIFAEWLPSTAAALIFAIHPIHTEAVVNVVGRAELLAALAVLAALLAFAHSLDSRGWSRRMWLALSAGAYGAAVLAKESAFSAAALVAVLHAWLDRSASLRARIAALLPYVLIALGYLALRRAVVGSIAMPDVPGEIDNPLAHVDLWSRLRTAVIVLGDYVGLLVLPLRLVADYSFNQVPVAGSWGDPRFLSAAALLALLSGLLVAAWRRAPVLVVAALFAIVPLALTANVLFPIGTIKAERLLYLPSLGWALACGWLVAAGAARHRGITLVAFTALLAAFAVRTWVRNLDWRDDDTLFVRTVEDAPWSAKAQFNAGAVFERTWRLEEAMTHYRRALDIYPRYGGAALGVGLVHRLGGDNAAAVRWYEKALRLDPQLAKAHLQIGVLRASRGEYDAAEAAFLSGLELEPNDPRLLVNWSAVRLAQGDRWGALDALARLDRIGMVEEQERLMVNAARNEIEAELR